MTDQPPLLDQTGVSLPGPQFVTRPGWGGQLRQWFSAHGTSLVFRLILIAILIIIGRSLWVHRSTNLLDTSTVPTPRVMILHAYYGDGITDVANRALHLYVDLQPEEIHLDEAQYLYAVDTLARLIGWDWLEEGQAVEFLHADIGAAVAQALALSPSQHAAWADLLKK